jgi:hypothetical protein
MFKTCEEGLEYKNHFYLFLVNFTIVQLIQNDRTAVSNFAQEFTFNVHIRRVYMQRYQYNYLYQPGKLMSVGKYVYSEGNVLLVFLCLVLYNDNNSVVCMVQ